MKIDKNIIAGIIIGAYLGLALSGLYLRPQMRPLRGPVADVSVKVVESNNVEINVVPRGDIETRIITPLIYLRERGQELGYNDFEITRIIQVMKCESGLRPDAINKNTNGTFDLGVGQINDVHSKRISREDRMDFRKNIDFIYQLYSEQGLNPWVCNRLI